jgi:FKBP-type peptidyl-prolyl cis-trans isomerase FkpA
MGRGRNLGVGLAAAGAVLALLLSGCGASLDSGVVAPSPTRQPSSIAAIPSPTPTPSPSAPACVSPSTQATYQLAGAHVLPGNLQVKDQGIGTGAKAKAGSTIKVSYTGALPDGTVFDSSSAHNKGQPISLTLAAGKVIAGWVEGIPGMRVGGTRKLVIPAALGYGCQSAGSIPVNSTLIFTVQLVGVS